MRNRRDRRDSNHGVFHITSRTVKGLPFIARLFMNSLIYGILARAQEFYPVQVVAFQWMGNHYHIILAGAGKHISPFIGYIQGELAKYLKRLVPFYQTKVWKTRFKEQRLCTPEAVIKTITYLYSNPVKAGLVDSIDKWPGVSSWKMYKAGSTTFESQWLPPRKLKLLKHNIDHIADLKLVKFIKQNSEQKHFFKLSPDLWKNFFEESRQWTPDYIFNEISSRLKELEKQYANERTMPVLGSKGLKKQSILKDYRPKKNTRTPYLICPNIELRKVLIKSYKDFCEACSEAWQAWKTGDLSVQFPPGAYKPGMPLALIRI